MFHTLDNVLTPASRLYDTHTTDATHTTDTHTSTRTTHPAHYTHTTGTTHTTHPTHSTFPAQDIDLLSQDLATAALTLLQRQGGVFAALPRSVHSSVLLRQALQVSTVLYFSVAVYCWLFVCTVYAVLWLNIMYMYVQYILLTH